MRFDRFAGNTRVKQQLNALEGAGRMPHAFLLEGESGCGKRTLARLIAGWALCAGEGEHPCGDCPNCRKAASGGHPDLFIASGESGSRSLHVDAIRSIRADAYILPNEAPRKVYLLFEADGMTEQAQNALLKVLEEPPEQALFVLTCRSASSLLSTIRSRTQIFRLEPLGEDEAAALLLQRRPETGEERARALAHTYGGNLGRMLASREDTAAGAALERAAEIARALTDSREWALLESTGKLLKDKTQLGPVLGMLELILRDALIRSSGGATCLSGREAEAVRLSEAFAREKLFRLLSAAQEQRKYIDQNVNRNLLVTCLCAQLRAAAWE